MKIICTKEEFAKMLEVCAYNRMVAGEDCTGCLFLDSERTSDDCREWLIDSCEIQKEKAEG